MIVPVNDAGQSVRFYTELLGLADEGSSPPFSVVRVSRDCTLQLAPWGTEGNMHLAFALEPREFEDAFARIRAAGIAYGDSFHDVGNMRGPGDEPGARGAGQAVYMFDPNKHLIEIRRYPD